MVVDQLGTASEGLERGMEKLVIGGQIETIQTTKLLKSATMSWRPEETCCHSDSTESCSGNAGVKNY